MYEVSKTLLTSLPGGLQNLLNQVTIVVVHRKVPLVRTVIASAKG